MPVCGVCSAPRLLVLHPAVFRWVCGIGGRVLQRGSKTKCQDTAFRVGHTFGRQSHRCYRYKQGCHRPGPIYSSRLGRSIGSWRALVSSERFVDALVYAKGGERFTNEYFAGPSLCTHTVPAAAEIYPEAATVYVGGLSWWMRDMELHGIMSQVGHVRSTIIRRYESGRSSQTA